MDSVTHIVCGACLGEIMGGKKWGKKALIAGAIAQSFPDIDMISSLWLKTPADLLAHRGITHSIFFSLLTAALLGFFIYRYLLKRQPSYLFVFCFILIQLFAHLFLDTCTSYGTGLWLPFSDQRVSINLLFVADPIFTLFTLVGTLYLVFASSSRHYRKHIAGISIVLSALYIGYSAINKNIVTRAIKLELALQPRPIKRYFSTCSPLNNQLWYMVAQTDSGYYTAYYSVWDKKLPPLHYYNRNEVLLPKPEPEEVRLLKQFSEGYYTIETWHDTLVFNDLRFGDMAGWHYPNPHFVFHFFIGIPDGNNAVVQRGRFGTWDKAMLLSFLQRIRGN